MATTPPFRRRLAGVTIAIGAMVLPLNALFAPFVLVGLSALVFAAVQNRALRTVID